MANFLTLTPRDPVVARDGRPFGIRQGNRMRSLSWLYPSVLAGSLRTMLGKEAGGVFDPVMVDGLKQISIAGPMPLIGNELFCPRPLDSRVQEQEGRRKALAMRPADPIFLFIRFALSGFAVASRYQVTQVCAEIQCAE